MRQRYNNPSTSTNLDTNLNTHKNLRSLIYLVDFEGPKIIYELTKMIGQRWAYNDIGYHDLYG
jgi:hypothetical protein